MLKLLLAAAVACPRAVAINSKGAPSYEAKMNLFAKNNRGESCASDEGLSDLDQQLLYAANTGNDKIVEVCLADGANPNAVVNGVSALMYAAQHGHLAVVDRLLAAGADPSYCDETNEARATALQQVATYARGDAEEVAKSLIRAGAPVDEEGPAPPLWRTVEHNQAGVARVLLEAGANVNVRRQGLTALMAACNIDQGVPVPQPGKAAPMAGRPALVKVLLEFGADTEVFDSTTDIDGGNALYHAARQGHTACVGALLDHGVTMDTICMEDGAAKGYHAQTALMGAVSGGHAETVALLLDRGADVGVTNKDGFNALWYAILGVDGNGKDKAPNERVIRLLLDAGADPNKRRNHLGLGSPTPLYWASEHGYEHAVAALLDNGADVDEIVLWENVTRSTALAAACSSSRGSVVKLLLRAGATVDLRLTPGIKRPDGTMQQNITALMQASCGGKKDSEEIVRMLLAAGADVSASADQGETPLFFASLSNSEGIVRMLLASGAPVAGFEGPLLVTSSVSIAELLIDAGVDIDARVMGNDGETPLMYHAFMGNEGMVNLLIEHGVDVRATDNAGNTAVEHAFEAGHERIAQTLLECREE